MTRYLPHLSDGVVVLRPWKLDDAHALMGACRDPDITYWLGLPSPYTFGHAMAWIDDARTSWRDGGIVRLAIVRPASGELLGSIDMRVVDPVESQGRFRFWVSAPHRRHGIARRAL
ncbi:MAG: GNAT family N-acetyltransferase, partial [Thermoleophilia bacterium]